MCFMYSYDGCLSTNATYIPAAGIDSIACSRAAPAKTVTQGADQGRYSVGKNGEGASKTIWKMEKNNKFQI
jgi:hypothetical protein